MLPTNLAAGIGLGQLDQIDDLQRIRKNIWEKYQNELNSIDEIITPQDCYSGDKHSYFTYCIKAKKRDDLAHYLLDNQIYTTLRYHPLHMNPIYNQTNITLKNTEILNKEALSIPIHPRITEAEQDIVIRMIKSFYNSK